MSKPVSTAQKLLTAEPNKDRLKTNPKADGMPVKPVGMMPHASRFWDQWVPELYRLGVVSMIDTPALEELCNWYQDYQRLCMIDCNVDPQGIGASRVATQKKQSWEQVLKLMKEFGMTAVSRNNVNAESVDEDQLKQYE